MTILSVIVPVYNTEKYLSKCINSLINQTFKDIEIICVNDGSIDCSGKILKEYAEKDSRIKIIEQNNQGQSAARNTGINVAQGEFITFIDSDDFLDTDCYETVLKYTKFADLVCFGIKLFGEAHMEKRGSDNEYYRIKYNGYYELEDRIRLRTDCSPCNKIFKKDIIDRYNIRFPEGLNYEDAAFYWKYNLCVNNIYFVKQYFYNYRRHNGTIMDKTFNNKSNIAIDHLMIAKDIYNFLILNDVFLKNIQIFMEIFKDYFYFAYSYSPKEIQRKVLEIATEIVCQMDIPEYYLENNYLLKNLKLKKYHKIVGVDKLPIVQRIFSIKNNGSGKIIRILGFKITTRNKRKEQLQAIWDINNRLSGIHFELYKQLDELTDRTQRIEEKLDKINSNITY